MVEMQTFDGDLEELEALTVSAESWQDARAPDEIDEEEDGRPEGVVPRRGSSRQGTRIARAKQVAAVRIGLAAALACFGRGQNPCVLVQAVFGSSP
jgi:hypothetical protein